MKTWMDTCAMAVCALASLAGLAAAAWVLLTGRIAREGLDALFLLLVALLFALMFGILPVQALRQGRWKGMLRRPAAAEVKEVKSEKPASA
jgi:hypothetical protein